MKLMRVTLAFMRRIPRTTRLARVIALAFCACAVLASPALAAAATTTTLPPGRLPDDTYFSKQWNLTKIRAPEAWQTSLGFEGVTIAIIDSGVDIDHPDLKDNVWRNLKEIPDNGIDDDRDGYVDDVHGWDFVGNDNDPRPDISGGYSVIGANHGTVDAGVAAARGGNGKGIAGVAWQATIMPIRVLDSNGVGKPEDVVRAVQYAVDNGAKIINLSLSGPSYNPALSAALRRAYDQGVFVVAATGNAPDGGEAVDLDKSPLYPVCFDSGSDENFVYGVAAVDENDVRAGFSNFGAACADISAPGTRIISTQFRLPDNKNFVDAYGGFYNGTSVAAAEVSGVVALIRALDYDLTPKQIMNILTETSVKIDKQNPKYFGKLGRGRIDAAAAVARTLELIHKQEAPPVPTASLLPPGTRRIIVTAPGKGRAPEIRMFTDDGTFIRAFPAFSAPFRGGVSLAMANIGGVSRNAIVAGAMMGGAPLVRVFDINSRLIDTFAAYDASFGGGVSVAAADIDGDGRDEIITGAGPGGGPHVRIFTPNGTPVGGFFAFDAQSRSGVNVVAADLDGDGKAEIIAYRPNGEGIKVFSAKGELRSSVATPKHITGVFIADANGDGKSDFVASFAAARGVPAYRAFGFEGFLADYAADGKPVDPSGLVKTPLRNLLLGSGSKSPPAVTVAGLRGMPLRFSAYEPSFRGGVSAAFASP